MLNMSEKLNERVSKLIQIYGMKKFLIATISIVDALEKEKESKGQGELPYLRLLSIDLEHALNNYERRYDALDSVEPEEEMEEEND